MNLTSRQESAPAPVALWKRGRYVPPKDFRPCFVPRISGRNIIAQVRPEEIFLVGPFQTARHLLVPSCKVSKSFFFHRHSLLPPSPSPQQHSLWQNTISPVLSHRQTPLLSCRTVSFLPPVSQKESHHDPNHFLRLASLTSRFRTLTITSYPGPVTKTIKSIQQPQQSSIASCLTAADTAPAAAEAVEATSATAAAAVTAAAAMGMLYSSPSTLLISHFLCPCHPLFVSSSPSFYLFQSNPSHNPRSITSYHFLVPFTDPA